MAGAQPARSLGRTLNWYATPKLWDSLRPPRPRSRRADQLVDSDFRRSEDQGPLKSKRSRTDFSTGRNYYELGHRVHELRAESRGHPKIVAA